MNPSVLDELIRLGQGKVRRLSCVLSLELDDVPSRHALEDGAKKAQKLFPSTAKFPVPVSVETSLGDWANRPLPSEEHLQLAVVMEGEKKELALKMSHLLGDAVSMVLWLKVVLGIAIDASAFKSRRYPSKKDTPYRSLLTSDSWPPLPQITPDRQIFRWIMEHKKTFPDASVFDLLALSLLNVLPVKRKSLWIPVNVRVTPWAGFGNGLSRLRLYPPQGKTLQEQLQHLRRQKKESFENGEVSLPPEGLKLTPAKKIFFKAWLNRPWADWATLSLSHLHDREGNVPATGAVWGMTNLLPKHSAAIFAFTREHQTFITLTADSSVNRGDLEKLMIDFKEEFQRLGREIQ